MSTTTNKTRVWCLERMKSPLQMINEGVDANGAKSYIFSGPCAEFDVVNENDRTYDKRDYLAQIDELQEEINANSLLGELDHSEDYMVKMKDVSHIIRKLWWNEEAKQVWITIELLDEGEGKKVKAMVDKGVPLYISSRASGFMDDDGNVTLEKIYTYDIVYRPGFKNAKLSRLNESKSFAIYEWKDGDSNKSPINNTNKTGMNDFVTKEDLSKLSSEMNDQMGVLKKMLLESKNLLEMKPLKVKQGVHNFSGKKPVRITEELEMKELKEGNSYMVKEGTEEKELVYGGSVTEDNGEVKYVFNTDSGDSEKRLSEDEVLKGVTAKPEEAAPAAAEGDDKPEDKPTEEITERVKILEAELEDKDTELEGTKELLQTVIDRINKQGEFINKVAGFVNNMCDKIDGIIKHADLMGGEINANADHNEVVVERLNVLSSTAKSLKEDVEEIANKENEVVEKVNKIGESHANLVKEMKNGRLKGFMINESSQRKSAKAEPNKNTQLDTKNLSATTDAILESVKKKKADENMLILEGRYPFFKYLNESGKQEFAKFNDAKKMRVSMLVESKKPSKTELASILSEVKQEDGELDQFVDQMPENFKPIWEGLKVKEKESVIALWHTRDIRDQIEVEAFFESLEFTEAKPVNVSESMKSKHNNKLVDDSVSTLGYNLDDVNI